MMKGCVEPVRGGSGCRTRRPTTSWPPTAREPGRPGRRRVNRRGKGKGGAQWEREREEAHVAIPAPRSTSGHRRHVLQQRQGRAPRAHPSKTTDPCSALLRGIMTRRGALGSSAFSTARALVAAHAADIAAGGRRAGAGLSTQAGWCSRAGYQSLRCRRLTSRPPPARGRGGKDDRAITARLDTRDSASLPFSLAPDLVQGKTHS